MFRLFPFRFGKQNRVPSFEQQYGPDPRSLGLGTGLMERATAAS